MNGQTGASKILRNLFVPPTFVQADGKNFGDMVKEKLVTYGDEWKDVNLADSQDGLYNPEKAKAEFAKAKLALQAEGVQFPIHLDMPVDQTATTSRTGRPILSKMVPFTIPFALSGNKGTSEPILYKYLELQDKAVTVDEYQKAQEKWMKEKEESNKKAQEDLAKHVK